MSKYIQEPDIVNVSEFDPIVWWRGRIACYPCLSETVKYMFCVPATSVPSERVFSTAGNIVTKKRSRLNPANVDILLFLNHNKYSVSNNLVKEI